MPRALCHVLSPTFLPGPQVPLTHVSFFHQAHSFLTCCARDSEGGSVLAAPGCPATALAQSPTPSGSPFCPRCSAHGCGCFRDRDAGSCGASVTGSRSLCSSWLSGDCSPRARLVSGGPSEWPLHCLLCLWPYLVISLPQRPRRLSTEAMYNFEASGLRVFLNL